MVRGICCLPSVVSCSVVASVVARLCTMDSPHFLFSTSGEPLPYRLVIAGVVAGWAADGDGWLVSPIVYGFRQCYFIFSRYIICIDLTIYI